MNDWIMKNKYMKSGNAKSNECKINKKCIYKLNENINELIDNLKRKERFHCKNCK